MKKSMIMFAVATLIGFTACEKENEIKISNSDQAPKYSILEFKTEEDFLQSIEKVGSFENKHQRTQWENSLNFKSFGSICDDFYYSIDTDKFSNFEEAKTFIENNSQYLTLVQDENGDYYCEPKDFRNPERYLCNEDGMYIIADKAYKIIEGKHVVGNIDDLELLKRATSLSEIDKNSTLSIIETEIHKKATKAAGPTKVEGQSDFTIDKQHYRLKVWIEARKSGNSFISDLSVKTMHRKLMIYWFMDAPIKYTYRHVLTDGRISFEATRNGENWITKSNTDPFIVFTHSGPNLGTPYYQSYNISVTNSVTHDGKTKGTTVTLVR